ncbi:YciI family protein [Streptomyces sp. NPDC057702]|uniref:YciI family protein n=1 Tax=unclassified Streptomyces TaxID=2593676 RepID=UPI00368DFB33
MVQLFGSATRWDEEIAAYSPQEFQAMVDHMERLNEDLGAAGELVQAEGLGGPALVTSVWARDDGPPKVAEGTHDGRAEVLAGYWVVDVADRDRAIEIAARASAAPGPGAAHNFPVEVHEIPSEMPR